MITTLLSRLVILLFGTLYPAYASFKAVRTKNIKEYVKWMMYWIVFGIFIALETLSDIFLGIWVPFYYELKILFIFWLISPATQGSSYLYRRCVHPWLLKHESEIDSQIEALKRKSYGAIMQWGSHGFAYVSNIVMQTAVSAWNTNLHPISGNHVENTISDWYQNSLEKNDQSLLKTSLLPSSIHLSSPSQTAKIVEIPAYEVYPSYSPSPRSANSISKNETNSDISTDEVSCQSSNHLLLNSSCVDCCSNVSCQSSDVDPILIDYNKNTSLKNAGNDP